MPTRDDDPVSTRSLDELIAEIRAVPVANDSAATALAVTVVTPNRRLARFLERRYDHAQRAAGASTWERPDILPLAAWLQREWRVLDEIAARPMRALDAQSARLVWERLIGNTSDANGLMSVPRAAREAYAAWQTAESWDLFAALRNAPVGDDTRRWLDWADAFRQHCLNARLIDETSLGAALADAARAGHFAPRIVAVGFDLVTPRQRELWRALRSAGGAVEVVQLRERPANNLIRHEFVDENAELMAVANWARATLQQHPHHRIAIVVPDLARVKPALMRTLGEVLSAQRCFAPQHTPVDAGLVNVSLGEVLGDTGLVRDAVALIDIALQPGQVHSTSRLLALMRSPFVAGAVAERGLRARWDVACREEAALDTSLTTLLQTAEREAQACPQLMRAIQDAMAAAAESRKPPHANSSARSLHHWSRLFTRILDAWGFPGDVPLESNGYQLLAAFRELLGELACLKLPNASARIGAGDAVQLLRRMAGEAVFQPDASDVEDARIEVLGALESGGQSFDALWVMGLDAENWPRPTRAPAFLPGNLLRKVGVPDVSPDAALKLDARLTDGWRHAARTVVFSHAQQAKAAVDTTQSRGPSALVREVPARAFLQQNATPMSARIAESIRLEWVEDTPPHALPADAPTRVRNGATLLTDQAACAFRAFARHRLLATDIDAPDIRPNAARRGTLAHRLMQHLWSELRDHATLLATPQDTLASLAATAARQVIDDARRAGDSALRGRLAELEWSRLTRLAIEWLEIEKARPAFVVVARETSRELEVGGLAMRLRLDRIDQLDDGAAVLIDYKTGEAEPSSWLGERPDQPQLPLYAASAEDHVGAVVFARLKRGAAFGFAGYSVVDGLIPGASTVEGVPRTGLQSWDELTAQWERAIASLAGEFRAGRASLNPKHDAITCAQCDLHGVCRTAAGASPDEGETGDG